MAGDYLAKYELFKNKFNITMLVAGFMWIIPLGMKLHIELATRSYPMGPVCVLEAIGGSVCVAGFFCFLEKKELRVLHCPGWEGILWLYWRCIVWR